MGGRQKHIRVLRVGEGGVGLGAETTWKRATGTGRSTQSTQHSRGTGLSGLVEERQGWSTQVGRDQTLESFLCQAWEFHLQPLVKLQFIKSR